MSKLIVLKQRKKTIDMIYRASYATYLTAFTYFQKTQKQINQSAKINDLILNYDNIIVKQYFSEQIMNKNAVNTAVILIGCNKGMCGNFSNEIEQFFKIHKNKFDYWFLFGNKLERFVNQNNTFGFYDISAKDAVFFDEVKKIFKLLKEKNICSLRLCSMTRNGIKNKVVLSKEVIVSSYLDSSLSIEIPAEIALLWLVNKVYQTMLCSFLEENKQRMIAASQAKKNAEDIRKVVMQLHNRARQEKITAEINELTWMV